VTLTVDDVGLLRAAGVSDGALTGLRRQILILHGAEAEPLLGSEPVGLSDDQERLLRQLVFKDTDITYRAALAPVSVPADINGPDLQSVFVWDTNTVVEGLDGYPALEKPRILGFALSNCQIVGAIARCEAIRLRTVTELVRDRPPEAISADQLRDTTESLVRTIASLRQDLDLGVEMHLLSAGIAGGRPLRQYHESIAAESDLPHLLKITRHLLNQLLGALRTDQELRGLQEARETAEKQLRIAEATQGLLDQTDAFKAATVIFASVAAVLGLAGLFAQAMAIPAAQQDTLLRSVPGGLVFTLVTVAVAVTLGLALRFAAKRAPRSTRARRWTRRLRWAAVLATGVAVAAALAVVLGHGPANVAVTLVTAATVGALTAVFCIALEFDFEAPQDR
jgi:hypothetical protein